MVPLLVRGLRHDNTTAIKRKASVIIENMAKLVDNPLDAVPFLPNLLPGLEKVANEVRLTSCWLLPVQQSHGCSRSSSSSQRACCVVYMTAAVLRNA